MNKPRSYDDLKSEAFIFWPDDLAEKERVSSIVPLLIRSQDKFISLLHVADSSPEIWKSVLSQTRDLPANLFLKHLIVLSDVGGEKLKRFKSELPSLFDDSDVEYVWHGSKYTYEFKTFDKRVSWDNASLSVDGQGLRNHVSLTPAMEDVAMLLMHGAAVTNVELPGEIGEKCIIGSLLGDKQALDTFVRQRYIWVSRITGGAAANTLGYLAEQYVREQLRNSLPNWDFSQKTIPGISHNEGRTNMCFDIVAQSPRGVFCAIEISFQVTTNSTIERKAGQAQPRQELLHRRNHHIAYVIDGAGNFERRSALTTILNHSDCSVSFKPSEIERLVNFLQELES